jgi:predicted DNA binding protein
MKELAREARQMARGLKDTKRDPEMAKVYAAEVVSLKNKTQEARANSPLERRARMIANKKMATILYNNPAMDAEHRKREETRQLDYARRSVGAVSKVVGGKRNPITDREWEAIQKGAISPTHLRQLLANCDKDRIKSLALPKQTTQLSASKEARIRTLVRNGVPRSDICEQLGISDSTLQKVLKNSKNN